MRLYPSRQGALAAQVGEINIHSPYDPQKEASKYISTLVLSRASVVILLGPGLGYLTTVLRSRYPSLRIVALHYSDELFRYTLYTDKDSLYHAWSPQSASSCVTFLMRTLKEEELPGLKILAWHPSARAFPEKDNEIYTALSFVLRRLGGNIMTTRTFGLRWIKNTILNFLLVERYRPLPSAIPYPIVIVASGPSLEETLSDLTAVHSRVHLWALPSALPALQNASILPDLLIATDPGYYAERHLSYLPPDVPVAMPLSAQRGLWRSQNDLTLLTYGTFFEQALLRDWSLPSRRLREAGTVAGTALLLAQSLSYASSLFFVGLDLANRDLQTHARPSHAFSLIEARANRLSPIPSLCCESLYRSTTLGTRWHDPPAPLRTYADWFCRELRRSRCRVGRIGTSPVALPGMENLSPKILRTLPPIEKKDLFLPPLRPPPRSWRKKRVEALLSSWEKLLDETSPEKGEISQYASTLIAYLCPREATLQNKDHKALHSAKETLAKLRDRYA